jgi:non-homologous end joining protein Ku
MRPYWKGYLKLALVSCPIALHAACSSAERIRWCAYLCEPDIAHRDRTAWLGM